MCVDMKRGVQFTKKTLQFGFWERPCGIRVVHSKYFLVLEEILVLNLTQLNNACNITTDREVEGGECFFNDKLRQCVEGIGTQKWKKGVAEKVTEGEKGTEGKAFFKDRLATRSYRQKLTSSVETDDLKIFKTTAMTTLINQKMTSM